MKKIKNFLKLEIKKISMILQLRLLFSNTEIIWYTKNIVI